MLYCFSIGKSQKDPEDWIQKVAKSKGVQNIKCIPWMNVNKLTKYLFASDVLFIPPTVEPMLKYGRTADGSPKLCP